MFMLLCLNESLILDAYTCRCECSPQRNIMQRVADLYLGWAWHHLVLGTRETNQDSYPGALVFSVPSLNPASRDGKIDSTSFHKGDAKTR